MDNKLADKFAEQMKLMKKSLDQANDSMKKSMEEIEAAIKKLDEATKNDN